MGAILMLLDAHCHVDHYNDPNEVLEESAKRGIFLIAVTNLPSHFEQGLRHVRSYSNVRLALGLHPLMADKHSSEMQLFERYLSETNYIGEVGLDLSRDGRKSFSVQKKSFEAALRRGNKFFSLHARMAEQRVLDMLLEANVRAGVFHWYSGSTKILGKALEAGYYFSVNPRMCLTKNGQSIISRIPLDRLLTETDGPFAGENRKPYYPWDVEKVIQHVSKIHSMPAEAVLGQIWENFRRLTHATDSENIGSLEYGPT
jgi:TatD DNase family protein